MKTDFYPPSELDVPSNYRVQLYDCSDPQHRKYAIELLSQYNGRRAPDNYEPDRLNFAFKRVKYLLVVEFMEEVVFAVCLGIHNNWLHITRGVKFKYWKLPFLMSVCYEKMDDICSLNNLDGMFATFNTHNIQLMQRIFRTPYSPKQTSWMWESARKNMKKFDVDTEHAVMFNSVMQYVAKTKSEKQLVL